MLNGQDSQPLNAPLVANFTLIGTGPGVVDAASGGYGMVLRRGTAGYYVNGVIARWPKSAMSLRDAASTGARINDGSLVVRNILATDNPTVFQAGQLTVNAAANDIEEAINSAGSLFDALPFDPESGNQFDWSLSPLSLARTGGLATFSGALAARAGTAITATRYRGAADPTGAKW